MPRAAALPDRTVAYAAAPAPVPFQAAMPPPPPMSPPTFVPHVPPPAPNPANVMPSQPQPMPRSLNDLPSAFPPASMPVEVPPLLDPEPAWLNSPAPAPSMNGADAPPPPLPWQVASEPAPKCRRHMSTRAGRDPADRRANVARPSRTIRPLHHAAAEYRRKPRQACGQAGEVVRRRVGFVVGGLQSALLGAPDMSGVPA